MKALFLLSTIHTYILITTYIQSFICFFLIFTLIKLSLFLNMTDHSTSLSSQHKVLEPLRWSNNPTWFVQFWPVGQCSPLYQRQVR